MDSEDTRDAELQARLKRLDAVAGTTSPGFNYDGMLERHTNGIARARRRLLLVRGAAVGLVVALLGASLWRIGGNDSPAPVVATATPAPQRSPQPRIVRADTYFAVATLEDHIASVDDAINVARLRGGQADVALLERTRAELIDSYRRVRYAEMVAANY